MLSVALLCFSRIFAGFTSGAALVIAAGQIKYVLGISYKKQDNLQGELGNCIALLKKHQFVWQEFVMVRFTRDC